MFFVMLLKEARDGFLFDCECRHLAKGSIRNYRAETKFLMEFLELKQITEVEDVKAHHIRDFMKQKQDSGNTACYVNDILKACKTSLLKQQILLSSCNAWGESVHKMRMIQSICIF